MDGEEENIMLQKADFDVFGSSRVMNAKGFQPRTDAQRIALKLPLDWGMDPLQDRNWRFQLQAWRMLGSAWSAGYGKDWRGLQKAIMPWVLDWHDFHVTRRLHSHFEWQDMAAGLRAQHLAMILHLQSIKKFALTPEQLAVVEELARLHISKLRDPDFISSGNHAIFQLVGLRLLGIVMKGQPELDGEEAYSGAMLRALLDSQFTPEGVHVENSPSYHNFAIRHFRRIRPALFPVIGGVFAEYLDRAEKIMPWLCMPDGHLAAIGDTEGSLDPVVVLPDPDHITRTVDGDTIMMRDLSRSGYAIVRSALDVPAHRASMLIVNGQAFSSSHAHADHLGFELYSHGRKLFIDSGKYTYNTDIWRAYFLSNRAHNVAGIAGETFKRDETTSTGSVLGRAYLSDQGEYVIEGSVTRRNFFTHQRRYNYLPGDRLRIEDSVTARDGDVAVLYFHLASDLDAQKASDGVVDVLQKGLVVARIRFDGKNAKVVIRRGEEGPEIQGWASPAYRKKEPSTVVEFHCSANIDAMRTTIELQIDESVKASGASLASLVEPGEEPPPVELLKVEGCPICGASFSGKRVANCPNCQSRRRTRSLSPLVNQVVAPQLERCPGRDKPLLAFSMTRAENVMLNRCYRAYKSVSLYGNYRDGHETGVDVRDLSRYAPESFSGMFACLLFDYFSDHERALREIHRVLTPGAPMFFHIAHQRLLDDASPPQVEGVVARGKSFDYVPKDQDFPSVTVGRAWLLSAIRQAGLECRHVQVTDSMTGLPLDWFIGIKPLVAAVEPVPPAEGKTGAPLKSAKVALTSLFSRKPKLTTAMMPRTHIVELNPGFGFNRVALTLSVPRIAESLGAGLFAEHVFDRGKRRSTSTVIVAGQRGLVISEDLGEHWDLLEMEGIGKARLRNCFTLDDGSRLVQGASPHNMVPSTRIPDLQAPLFRLDSRGRITDRVQPARNMWHGPRAIDQSNGTIMYAEYPLNAGKYAKEFKGTRAQVAELDSPKVLRSRDGGRHWEVVLEISWKTIRHFHTLQADPHAKGTWWLSSGDKPEESRVWRSRDDGDSWQEMTDPQPQVDLPAGAQANRLSVHRYTDLVILADRLLWGTDDVLGPRALVENPGAEGPAVGSRMFQADKGDRLKVREIGYVGNQVRSIVDVGPAWLLTTEAKALYVRERPQILLMSKTEPYVVQELFMVEMHDGVHSGFTHSVASRAAREGRFFSMRKSTDVFPQGPGVLQWDINFE